MAAVLCNGLHFLMNHKVHHGTLKPAAPIDQSGRSVHSGEAPAVSCSQQTEHNESISLSYGHCTVIGSARQRSMVLLCTPSWAQISKNSACPSILTDQTKTQKIRELHGLIIIFPRVIHMFNMATLGTKRTQLTASVLLADKAFTGACKWPKHYLTM